MRTAPVAVCHSTTGPQDPPREISNENMHPTCHGWKKTQPLYWLLVLMNTYIYIKVEVSAPIRNRPFRAWHLYTWTFTAQKATRKKYANGALGPKPSKNSKDCFQYGSIYAISHSSIDVLVKYACCIMLTHISYICPKSERLWVSARWADLEIPPHRARSFNHTQNRERNWGENRGQHTWADLPCDPSMILTNPLGSQLLGRKKTERQDTRPRTYDSDGPKKCC